LNPKVIPAINPAAKVTINWQRRTQRT